MQSQGLDRIEGTCKVRLAERGMDLPVADVMQQDRRSVLSAFQLGDQVVKALGHAGWDRPAA